MRDSNTLLPAALERSGASASDDDRHDLGRSPRAHRLRISPWLRGIRRGLRPLRATGGGNARVVAALFRSAEARAFADGACTTTPQRRLRHYANTERWGFIWAWLGDAPGFSLPELNGHRWVLLPQRVRAHPDTTFANGFDLAHFGPSHGIEVATRALEIQAPWQISHRIEGRLPYRPRLAWAGLGGAPLDATFTQCGGGIVQVHVRRPLDYKILFTIRPDANGHSRTR